MNDATKYERLKMERSQPAMDGAAAVLAALLDVPASERLDALALACDAFIKGAARGSTEGPQPR